MRGVIQTVSDVIYDRYLKLATSYIRSINTGSKYQQNSVINTAETIFIIKPVVVMCLSFNLPLANTIALGGVPIGSMPAQLAPSVMAIPNWKGSI